MNLKCSTLDDPNLLLLVLTSSPRQMVVLYSYNKTNEMH